LHTVLRRPTAEQRRIVEQLGRLADRLVVQSAAARVRLLEQYSVAAERVETIPHRPRLNPAPEGRRPAPAPAAPSRGRLSAGKGSEWGVDAIAMLSDLQPAPRYVVVGQTHPKVLELYGEEYRESLRARAGELGVADRVELDDSYHDTRSLMQRIREADVVLLPYQSREQVVSGVLVEALASGKPVVATRFPHAEELLAGGAGVLVPPEDPLAIAHAPRRPPSDQPAAAPPPPAGRRPPPAARASSSHGRPSARATSSSRRSSRTPFFSRCRGSGTCSTSATRPASSSTRSGPPSGASTATAPTTSPARSSCSCAS